MKQNLYEGKVPSLKWIRETIQGLINSFVKHELMLEDNIVKKFKGNDKEC